MLGLTQKLSSFSTSMRRTETPAEVLLDADTNGPLNNLFTSPLLRTPLSGGVEVRNFT
jgi:hypothetical protein